MMSLTRPRVRTLLRLLGRSIHVLLFFTLLLLALPAAIGGLILGCLTHNTRQGTFRSATYPRSSRGRYGRPTLPMRLVSPTRTASRSTTLSRSHSAGPTPP